MEMVQSDKRQNYERRLGILKGLEQCYVCGIELKKEF